MAERGFHAVGIADIGAAAGVSGSAIYRHFRSKQEILAALLDPVVDGLLAGASRSWPTAPIPWYVRRTCSSAADIEFALRDPRHHRRVLAGGEPPP